MTEPRQLVFELPHRSALGAEDFLVGASNAAAVALLDQWPAWPHWAAVVVGPQGCGKSHLGNVWRMRAAAAGSLSREFTDAVLPGFEQARALLVEDLHEGVADERALFHALNLAREHRLTMLLTSRHAPGELAIALPDLRSRLRALPLVHIEPPDDVLLQAVLVKLFADRQLEIEPRLVSYLALHLDRSMAAATEVVAAIDKLALAMQRKVTRPIIASVLANKTKLDEAHDETSGY